MINRHIYLLVLLAVSLLTACGGEVVDIPCDPGLRDAARIKGRLYLDETRTGFSNYVHGFIDPAAPEVEGLGGLPVKLHVKDRVFETLTCSDGWYFFTNELHPGLENYFEGFIEYPRTDCTTNNCATHWTKKINQYPVKLLTWGDSIPSYPKNETWFPARFVALARSVVNIEDKNIAVPGTKSYDWTQQGAHHDQLMHQVRDSDIVVFSVGGNDIFKDVLVSSAIHTGTDEVVKKVKEQTDKAIQHIKSIIDTIRTVNKDVDILLVTYLDYSEHFSPLKIVFPVDRRDKFKAVLQDSIEKHRRALAGYKGVQLVDIYGRTTIGNRAVATKVSDLLIWDNIHLSEKGHMFYSRHLFDSLGGWLENDDSNNLLNQNTYGKVRYIGYPTR